MDMENEDDDEGEGCPQSKAWRNFARSVIRASVLIACTTPNHYEETQST